MLCTMLCTMDGFDTLPQVTLADLGFETYNPPNGQSGRHDSVATEGELNTPVNKTTGVEFSFGPTDISQEAVPITGKPSYFIVVNSVISYIVIYSDVTLFNA